MAHGPRSYAPRSDGITLGTGNRQPVDEGVPVPLPRRPLALAAEALQELLGRVPGLDPEPLDLGRELGDGRGAGVRLETSTGVEGGERLV